LADAQGIVDLPLTAAPSTLNVLGGGTRDTLCSLPQTSRSDGREGKEDAKGDAEAPDRLELVA